MTAIESQTHWKGPSNVLTAGNDGGAVISSMPNPIASRIKVEKIKGTMPEVTAASAAMGSEAPTIIRSCDHRRPGKLEPSGKPSFMRMNDRAANADRFTHTTMKRILAPRRLPQ